MGKEVVIKLKEQLDDIDRQVYETCYQNYWMSRKNIYLSQWKKGEAISGRFRGVDLPPSYRQLERETGRGHVDLKKWHMIHKKNSWEQWDEKAEEMARIWTENALEKEKGKYKELSSVPLPEGKYSVIYADPPWEYTSGDQHTHTSQETVLGTHYKTPRLWTIEELCDLPITDMSHENCLLFLWVTSPLLRECFDVIQAWGFDYKTSMVWDKVKHNVGNYVSVRHEFLLICAKGVPPKVPKLVDSVYVEERTEHSKKPEYFRNLIQELYPNEKKIELFARGKLPEPWEGWGDEYER